MLVSLTFEKNIKKKKKKKEMWETNIFIRGFVICNSYRVRRNQFVELSEKKKNARFVFYSF